MTVGSSRPVISRTCERLSARSTSGARASAEAVRALRGLRLWTPRSLTSEKVHVDVPHPDGSHTELRFAIAGPSARLTAARVPRPAGAAEPSMLPDAAAALLGATGVALGAHLGGLAAGLALALPLRRAGALPG